jgi:hypothetical protein
MRKIAIWGVLALMVLAIAAVPALAANPQFGPGKRAATFTDNGQTLTVSGTLSGLGQEQFQVTVTANATATTFCYNPSDPDQSHPVPGQTLTNQPVSGSTGVVTPDKNGNYKLNLTTTAPTVTAAQAGCPGGPNTDWTASIGDVTFSNVRVFLEQPLGTTPVLIASYPGTVPAG